LLLGEPLGTYADIEQVVIRPPRRRCRGGDGAAR